MAQTPNIRLNITDKNYAITNLFSPTEGLAPKGKEFTNDNAVVVIFPGIINPFSVWKHTRHGLTLDQTSLLSSFELVNADNEGSKLFLTYDYAQNAVVLKNDSRPVWIISQDVGGPTQFQIKLLFPGANGTLYLTYDSSGTQVKVTTAASGNNAPKQVWNIAPPT